MKTFFTRSHASAFSLVEVTIAVAIAALGFITLLGLLPQGIHMARDTAQMSIGAKIIQKLSGEMQSIPWSHITWKGYGKNRYFDSEGTEITASSSSSGGESLATSLSYVASVYVPDTPLDVILPANGSGSGSGGGSGGGGGGGGGAGSSSTPEPYLRRVRICVAATSDPSFNFASAPPMRITSANALIAETGN